MTSAARKRDGDTDPSAPASWSGATDTLRADILRGALTPGQRLIEVELATRYGVGRAAIRTALTELAKEGLVDRQANRGAMVRRITLEEAVEITEVRAELESLLARRAATLCTPAEREELDEIIAAMRRQVATMEFVAYAGLNRRLHERIRQVGRHRVGAELVENLRNRSASHQFRIALLPGRSQQSLREHEEIVRAINAGDPDCAGTAMRSHLLAVIDSIHRYDKHALPF